MKGSKMKYSILFLPLLAIYLTFQFMKLPETFTNFNIALVVFLCFISILERRLVKFYTPLWFSFFIVVLGQLIFDENSIFYSLFYFGTGFVFTIVKKRGTSILNHLTTTSIGIIAIILGNEYYNRFTEQSYIDRYLTFIFLLILSIILANLYFYLEFNRTQSTYMYTILPILFKLVVIFPILSFYNYFNFFMITVLFFLYLFFLNFCRKTLLSISDTHVQELMDLIKQKHKIDILFMELGDIKGMFYPKKSIIAIDEKLDYPEQLQTIVHEYLHYYLNKKGKSHFLLDELLVTMLEGIVSWVVILKVKKGVNA
ncbi:ImmA/IrrE family metallo-endopeptidase [Pseudoneobacillus rhizosphaerae]|uniref:IrrE N-terminal-like domain-containing protein n=1 Tax=Pseudoneobacillus rhizosphaerae TaxID=2880968 RepID=A0A9C7L986_9BACI|nr:ImmA/IrrE family metallo-endopeptidase [Pseudoneobacillus rhizosphaerae]CAG9607816.1 hypothetical protein NEOCIP111885_01508 [Pseudoneobacillus rhizosphaerae]